MSDMNFKNQFHLKNQELNRQTGLMEEQLHEKETVVAALQDSEKRYRRLFESAKDGILILDAGTGQIVDVNPFLLKLLGYSYDELYGQHIWEIGLFKDIAASKDAFRTLQDNEYIRYEHLPLETRDGRVVDVEFVSNTYLVDHTKVIQCNIRDITARRRAEKALLESEAKTRSILDNIGIGVALISPKMEILELNHQMHKWFPDIDPDQHPICYCAFNDPPRDAVCDACPTFRTLADGMVHEATTQTPRAGKIRNYRIVSSPILKASGEVMAVIGLFEDITEKLSMESQFFQAQKMEAVGRLAGGVAHDFNNILTVILGYAELGLNKVNPSDSLYDDLQEILDAASRSRETVRQLLAFARKQIIEPRVIDLNDTVEGMLKMLRPLIGEDIDLAWFPGYNIWPIRMDPSQLDQILANLCVNARDAIADVGRISIETDRVSFDNAYCDDHLGFVPGDFVLLTVSDNGCGMDRETRDRLFEPFFTTKEVGRGTGLGLSTVYGIVKQNDGFINVYSEPGNGTTFKIYLPRHEGVAVDSKKDSAGNILYGHGEIILIVEDDVTILNLARIMLEKLGYTVLSASTPAEAIRLADAHPGGIRLLISDVVMPEMNGRILANQLHSRYPDIKILFMSGYTADVIAHRGVLNKGVWFIQKPFSMKDLGVKVHEALGQELYPAQPA